jgi:hypothetical protein
MHHWTNSDEEPTENSKIHTGPMWSQMGKDDCTILPADGVQQMHIIRVILKWLSPQYAQRMGNVWSRANWPYSVFNCFLKPRVLTQTAKNIGTHLNNKTFVMVEYCYVQIFAKNIHYKFIWSAKVFLFLWAEIVNDFVGFYSVKIIRRGFLKYQILGNNTPVL